MTKLPKPFRKAVLILIVGILVSLFIMFNAKTYLLSAVLYIVMGVLSILAYFIWDSF